MERHVLNGLSFDTLRGMRHEHAPRDVFQAFGTSTFKPARLRLHFHVQVSSSADNLTRALAILRANGVVGMPTETVYGLAADARSSDAVARIFALKGRPATNPLIVHVASVEVGERYAMFDDRARKLFERFAPGALTIVLPKRAPHAPQDPDPLPQATRETISPLATAGLDTVGIRIPNHPVALALLRAFDGPLAAPSANKSNHVSPTTAQHVRDEFGEEVFVLDGGACEVGIESTVLDLSCVSPVILRPGHITRAQIESVIGPVRVFAGHVEPATPALSPGQQRVHYAPRAPAYRFELGDLSYLRRTIRPRSALIVLDEIRIEFDWASESTIVLGHDPDHAAARFYSALRELDALSPSAIYIQMPPDEPQWAALRDRITRATVDVERWLGSRRMP